MDGFTLSANTLLRTVKDNPADRIEVEIGDSKQLDFKPQFKVSRWDNEVNFSMRAQEEAGATMVEEDGKVKYKGRDIEVHQYEKPEASKDGGFEFEWVLKNKPESNVLRTTIQHKGLDFFYQPALTAEEIKQGNVRDENVVGSYAVYHSTKQNNIVGGMEYQTGKAFHIYRPHAVDADGVKVWCELDIKKGELTVTVPKDFLNKAIYPVVVDPTFGYTSGGASFRVTSNNSADSSIYGNLNDSVSGSLNSVHTYVASDDVGTAYFNFAFGDGGATRAGATNIIDSTLGANVTGTSPSWKTYTASNESFIATSRVGLTAYFEYQGTNHLRSYYDTGSNTDSFYITGDSFSYILTTTVLNSVYATYTAASSYNPAFAHRRLLLK